MGICKRWTDGYAVQSNGDWGGAYHERGEIFDTVRDAGITGFAILAGDLHSFWAGYAAKSLPPHGKFEPTMNLLLNHGVRSALEYAESGDLTKAHAVSNPELAPHLEFVDLGGHGYGVVSVDATRMVTDFVCIPRPIERAATPDGGPLRYRVRHEIKLWQPGDAPQLLQSVLEGDAALAL